MSRISAVNSITALAGDEGLAVGFSSKINSGGCWKLISGHPRRSGEKPFIKEQLVISQAFSHSNLTISENN